MLMQGRLTRRMSLGCRASMLILGATILAVSVHARPAASAGPETSDEAAIAVASAVALNADGADVVGKESSATAEKDVATPEKDIAKADAAAPANAAAPSATTNVSKRLDELEAKIRHLEAKLSTPSATTPPPGSSFGSKSPSAKSKRRESTIPVRVKLNCPKGTNVSVKDVAGSEIAKGDSFTIHFVMQEGQPTEVQNFELTLSNFPGHESADIVATLRVEPPSAMTIMYLLSNPVSVEITAEDIGQILADGSMLKVVYLDRAAQTAKSGNPLRTRSTTSTTGKNSEITQIVQEAHANDPLAMLSIRRTAMTYLGGKEKMAGPPTAEEVINALPDVSEYELLDVKRRRSNIRVNVEQTSNERGEPLFKCTAHYRETMSARLPVRYSHEEDKTTVVYLDRDHRCIRVEEAASGTGDKVPSR